VLSHDYVGPPLPHRGPHGRQHRAHVKRREHLSHDQPLGVVGGQGPDTRPQSPEFIFWRGAPDPEWVTGALHRVGERRRPAPSVPRPVGARGGIIPSRHSLREASRSGPASLESPGAGPVASTRGAGHFRPLVPFIEACRRAGREVLVVPALGPPEAGALCDRCAWQRAAPSDTGEATRPRSGRLRGSAFEAHSGGTATWRRPSRLSSGTSRRSTDAAPMPSRGLKTPSSWHRARRCAAGRRYSRSWVRSRRHFPTGVSSFAGLRRGLGRRG
jgi:hypothetical protein